MLTLQQGPFHILAQGRNRQPGYRQGEAEMIWANYCRHGKASTWEHHVLSAPCSESCLLFFVCAHACTWNVCFSLTDVISFLASLLTAYYAICDLKTFGEPAGKKKLFDSSRLLHSGSSRASWKTKWDPAALWKRGPAVNNPRVLVFMVLWSLWKPSQGPGVAKI